MPKNEIADSRAALRAELAAEFGDAAAIRILWYIDVAVRQTIRSLHQQLDTLGHSHD